VTHNLEEGSFDGIKKKIHHPLKKIKMEECSHMTWMPPHPAKVKRA